MLHRGESYVNLLSNSPINTSYPRYGALNFDYLDDTLEVPLNYHKTENSNIFCPVQIHVNPRKEDPEERNLLDFDSDDDLLENENYILIDEDLSFDITPKRHPYPDANSHSNYNFFNDKSRSISPFKSHSLAIPYSIANSHRHIHQESNSHTNYILSDTSEKNEETSYEDASPYSIENSHGIYKILSESSDRISTELLIPADDHNYDIANSHSNYQIFYNSQIQHEIEKNASKMEADDESSHSSRCTEESSTCDIEECLIQIEESLLNIEENLLHVQDLNIPELKHLLYKSPSIERSLFEVQDLLCTENIESARRGELFTLVSDESQELNTTDTASNLEDFQDSEEVVFTNEKNLLHFADDKSTSDLLTSSISVPSVLSLISVSNEKNVNFPLNSLSRTPTKCKILNAGKNIRMCFSEENVSRDYKNLDSVNYNYNNSTEQKLCFKKVHSRSNSLDENSIFQSTEFQHQRKTSLENLFSGRNYSFQRTKVKTKADLNQFKIQRNLKVPQFKRSKKKKTSRLAEVEAKTEEFRRKIKNIISSRSAYSGFANRKRLSKTVRITSTDSCDNAKDKNSVDNKSFGHDRRKRKKIVNKSQTEENAVVPSKLISLSLSLLLAALLQAVRCLTDLVEGAFRSVSFDQNGLLQ